MSSVDHRVKRGASVAQDIINKLGGSPFHKAVEELCVAVIELLPNLPEEKTVRLGRALGNLQEASLSQTTSTAAATIVRAAEGLTAAVEALQRECRANHAALMARLDEHLNAHEAGT